MLGLVAGKSCNLWVSCNFRMLQLVDFQQSVLLRCIHVCKETIDSTNRGKFLGFKVCTSNVQETFDYNWEKSSVNESKK